MKHLEPLCSPQIPHHLTSDRTRAAVEPDDQPPKLWRGRGNRTYEYYSYLPYLGSIRWTCSRLDGQSSNLGKATKLPFASMSTHPRPPSLLSNGCRKCSSFRRPKPAPRLQCVAVINHIFWDITPCSSVAACFMLVSSLAYSPTLKMQAICSSETSVGFRRPTRHHIPEDRTTLNSFVIVYILSLTQA
jgi:hypothetical protein